MPWALLAIVAVGLILLGSGKALAYVRGKAVEIDLAPVGSDVNGQTAYLRADAAAQFLKMKAHAASQGISLIVEDAFRSMDDQIALYTAYQNKTGNLAAKPGYSNHQSGIAVDIRVGNSFTSPVYLWLNKNAPTYGWVNKGKSFPQPEPWHWEFIA